MGRFLIVNADDFGLTDGINRAIIKAFTDGVVTSTSMMVNMPGFANAIDLAKEHPTLAVGLHLNLTYGRPVLPVERVDSLVNESGCFRKNPAFVLGNGRPEEMILEFSAQMRRFTDTGLLPSHIDTHHHLHQAERVLDLVVELAKDLGVPIRCLDDEAVRARGMTPAAGFIDFFGGHGNGVERLIGLIRSLPEGVSEIPTHPGYCDEQLRELSPLNEEREQELITLLDPEIQTVIKDCGIRLTNYRDLFNTTT